MTPAERIARVLELRDSGMTYQEIGLELNLHTSTVQRIVQRMRTPEQRGRVRLVTEEQKIAAALRKTKHPKTNGAMAAALRMKWK